MIMKIKAKEIMGRFSIDTRVPLRAWKKNWGLPDLYKTETSNTTIVVHSEQKLISRTSLWGRIESYETYLRRKRTHKKWGLKTWRKGQQARGLECKIIDGYIWVKIMPSWHYHGELTPDKFSFDGKYLKFSLERDEIGVWYLSGDKHVRYIILPSEIEVTDELLELIGIFDGEMTERMNKTGGTAFRVTNSEPLIIKDVVSRCKMFGVSSTDWRVSITVNSKDNYFSNEKLEEIKNFWLNVTNIPLSNIGKITIQNKYLSKFSPRGIVQLRYSNMLFYYFIRSLIEKLHNIILGNKNFIASYLRGLMAAEGGIGLRKNGDLRFVQIAGTKRENKEFYMKCLGELGVTSFKEYQQRIEIYSNDNFKLLNSLDVFGLHPVRKLNFDRAFVSLNKRIH